MFSILKLLVLGAILLPIFTFAFPFWIGAALMILMFLAFMLGQDMKIKNVIFFALFCIGVRIMFAVLGSGAAWGVICLAGFYIAVKTTKDWLDEESKRKERDRTYM
jgi:hypothetical protein